MKLRRHDFFRFGQKKSKESFIKPLICLVVHAYAYGGFRAGLSV